MLDTRKLEVEDYFDLLENKDLIVEFWRKDSFTHKQVNQIYQVWFNTLARKKIAEWTTLELTDIKSLVWKISSRIENTLEINLAKVFSGPMTLWIMDILSLHEPLFVLKEGMRVYRRDPSMSTCVLWAKILKIDGDEITIQMDDFNGPWKVWADELFSKKPEERK